MSAANDLLQSRNELIAVLNEKLKNVPEWRAFLAVDRAVEAANEVAKAAAEVAAGAANQQQPHSQPNGSGAARATRRPPDAPPSYVELGLRALNTAGVPLTTPNMISFISQHREVPDDPEKAKINISSAFSHDDRLRSIAWHGGRSWWFADRPPPSARPPT